MVELSALAGDALEELSTRILPFWTKNTPDPTHGGFVGRIDGNLSVVRGAPKGAVLNCRVLWTFSASYSCLRLEASSIPSKLERLFLLSRRALEYLQEFFADPERGGIYWMLDYKGDVLEAKKQVYAQAFAIYALSEFHSATGEEPALEWARDIYRLIEEHAFDPVRGGYYEAFSRDWGRLDDVRLSEKDANEQKTMNTHLHVLEAYTNLYRNWNDPGLREQLAALIRLFLSRFIDSRTHHLNLFFDEDWNLRSRTVSFGHDIECSWLLVEAAEALEDETLLQKTRENALAMVDATLRDGTDRDGSLYNEREGQRWDRDRHWWPQAEAVVALVNAYQISGDDSYLHSARRTWDYIQGHLVDGRCGEWFSRVSPQGQPYLCEDVVGPWKGPYHNSRACIELVRRAEGASRSRNHQAC